MSHHHAIIPKTSPGKSRTNVTTTEGQALGVHQAPALPAEGAEGRVIKINPVLERTAQIHQE